jgi:lipoprotein-anchoring transpeptidase ErfK/SrfK
MQLISYPILLLATAALAVSALAAPVRAQDGRPLILTAPRHAAPAYARADERAPRDRRVTRAYARDFASDAERTVAARMAPPRGQLGGGFLEFLFGGNPRSYTELPRQPYANPWHDAAAVPGYDDRTVVLASRGDPAVPARSFDPRFAKTIVNYSGDEKPGTVVIDTKARFLYLVQDDGKAIRYGVGVGRDGFRWNGVEKISLKKEWPDWIPPKEMLLRQPELPTFMPGGIDNPLGARALYLGATLYRIHGSNEPWTIGQAVSSGCIRMRNEDVIDLYDRVKIGTVVRVI